jgi:uncharacterized membrane protein YqjE
MTIRHSLGQVASDLAAMLQTRAELFSVELAAQRVRFFSLLGLFGIAIICLLLALVIFSILVVLFFWSGELRYWAIGGLALVYATIGLGLCWRLAYRLKTDATPFEITRKELSQDLATLNAWRHNVDRHPRHNDDKAEQHER